MNTASAETDTALIKAKDSNEEALGYLIRFNYDSAKSDYGLYDDDALELGTINYPLIKDSKYWAVSKNGEFNLYDGEYISSQIYLINKSGAVSNLSSNNLNDLFNEFNLIPITGNKTFYIDTVAPRVVNKIVSKIEDANGIPLKGSSLPFKENDLVTYSFEIEDYNYDKADLNFADFMERLLYINESFDDNLTSKTIHKNFKVIYNQLASTENINLSTLIYDKAENSQSANLSGIYNSNMPKQMKFVEEIYENSIKFTKDKDLTLNSFGTGEDIYYAEVLLGNLGQAKVNTLPTKLNTFSLSALENLYNIGTITTYSSSGQKGVPYIDYIVVDTDINHSNLVEAVARKNSSGNFIASIRFDSIRELVGLNGVLINTPSVIVTNGSLDMTGYYPLFGANYFTSPTASNITTVYNLQLPASKPQSIQITLKDRLGNTKTFEQEIDYVDMIKIIGSSNDSNRTINTTVELGNNRKILFRNE